MAQRKGADRAVGLGIQDQRQRKGQLAHAQPLLAVERRQLRADEVQLDGPDGRHLPGAAHAGQVERNAQGDHDQRARQCTAARQPDQQRQCAQADGRAAPVPMRRQPA